MNQDNSSTISETYKFTGKPVSTTTGLYYYYHRWYDPSVGRFVSEDSLPSRLSDPQSSNKYGYVNNAPTTFTDPSGLGMVVGNGRLPCWDWFGLIPCHQGGVGGLVSATTTSLSTSPGGAPVIIAGIGLYLGAEVPTTFGLIISLLAPSHYHSRSRPDNGHGTTGFTDSTGPITTLPRTVGPNGSIGTSPTAAGGGVGFFRQGLFRLHMAPARGTGFISSSSS